MTSDDYETYLNQTGRRCPRCGWALHDGRYSMNKDCHCDETVQMTNREAHALADKFKATLAAK